MLCARRYGQFSGRASNCAYRRSFSICASSPNRSQITQNAMDLEKRNLHFRFSGSFPETRKQALFADCAKYLGKLPR